ncbi:MAG: asparagine synthase C-terminal domain-containing protein, partial [Phycisphaerales bacterium]|nr:asparagine synthase C-terminal domain-containing protein [Phycisphaerales bacterium]
AIERLRTFSMRMPDARYDESSHAEAVARHLGTDHRTLECDADPASDLVHLIRSTDLPLGDSSLLPTYWISRAAREHVKVVVTGDGGDELFGGYHRHVVRRIPRIVGLVPSILLSRRTPRSWSERLARLKACYFDPTLLRAVFEPADLRRLIGEGPDMTPAGADPLTDDFESYLPQDLFRKVDVASMAVGLEARTPFMSRDLVRACLGAPLESLMPGGERKGLLRAVARRHLPGEVVDRPKMGFAIPVGEWFRTDHGGMRTLLHDMLGSVEPFRRVPLPIDMDEVRRLLREHDDAGTKSLRPWKGRDHAQRLYVLLVLAIWSEHGDADAGA